MRASLRAWSSRSRIPGCARIPLTHIIKCLLQPEPRTHGGASLTQKQPLLCCVWTDNVSHWWSRATHLQRSLETQWVLTCAYLCNEILNWLEVLEMLWKNILREIARHNLLGSEAHKTLGTMQSLCYAWLCPETCLNVTHNARTLWWTWAYTTCIYGHFSFKWFNKMSTIYLNDFIKSHLNTFWVVLTG